MSSYWNAAGINLGSGDITINNRLFVGGDISINNRVLVGSDVSLGGRLFVQNAATFQTAPTMAGNNVQAGTIPITSVVGTAMDLSTSQTVGGTKIFQNQITTTGGIISTSDVSFNSRVLVGSDVSLGGRLFVPTGSLYIGGTLFTSIIGSQF